ncbi:Transcriptional regulator [Hyella patelloides LEGE 07179]|uniref:Transcriptional regulator n=1 Tax=Hyella patelloides LEGE 07179 TaxID=945734 RepID=A0A563VUB7_9CYAN|nr:TetR/AcrR family transcriptional regulator [Hyella patelloides]VEP15040.1 Transcriptional regulator [Hyella patelloides LEGE 07179]
MARKKEFDKEEVLTKAMQTFLRLGYEGTSMQTLVSTMGINRGSLYDTFGDKHSLFLAVIAHYEETVVKDTVGSLMTPDADKQTIVELFRGLVEAMAKEQNCYGCLMTNTAVELSSHDAEAKDRINNHVCQMVRSFKHALTNARAKGEINSDRNLDAMAQYLTSNLQGLRVMGKVNRDPQILNNIVDVILLVLD